MAIIIGIESTTLTTMDQQRLLHPACIGVILFRRNYRDVHQLQELCASIRETAPDTLICTDHEGGRVQRFQNGFTMLPNARTIGELFHTQPLLAEQLTQDIGIIIAHELGRCGIDFSFTPVLDLYDTISDVIVERAFSSNPAVVSTLAIALRRGLRRGGMAAVGKHYPGHGRVQGDSHYSLPRNSRLHHECESDRYPFIKQIQDGIEGLMMAHIIDSESNNLPAGFSPSIISQLRDNGFDGAIFSDDLDMVGAKIYASTRAQVAAALAAGTDITLICNNFNAIDEALTHIPLHPNPPALKRRIQRLKRIPNGNTNLAYHAALTHFHTHQHLLT